MVYNAVEIANRAVVSGVKKARKDAMLSATNHQGYKLLLNTKKKSLYTVSHEYNINQEQEIILYEDSYDLPSETDMMKYAYEQYYTNVYGFTLQEQILALEVNTDNNIVRRFRIQLYKGKNLIPIENELLNVECFAFQANTVVICVAAFLSLSVRNKLQYTNGVKTRESLYIKLSEYNEDLKLWKSVEAEKMPKDYGYRYCYEFWYRDIYNKPYKYMGNGVYEMPTHFVVPRNEPNKYKTEQYGFNSKYEKLTLEEFNKKIEIYKQLFPDEDFEDIVFEEEEYNTSSDYISDIFLSPLIESITNSED